MAKPESASRLTASVIGAAALVLPSGIAMAATGAAPNADFTGHWVGFASIVIFVLALALVIGEEAIHLRKSKPVMVAAGIIWALVAGAFVQAGDVHTAGAAVRHNLLEFAELFLFLLAAMTYINSMDERGVFDALRARLVSRGFSFRALFWITGAIAFALSPIADNLTTALLMATVVMAVGVGQSRFVAVSCVNIVVAANAGGAFSPFGDITTLMVWQKGIIAFEEFFVLLIPSLVNWLVPAAIMMMALPAGRPDPLDETPRVLDGGWVMIGLFLVTIAAGGRNDDRARYSQALRLLPRAARPFLPGAERR